MMSQKLKISYVSRCTIPERCFYRVQDAHGFNFNGISGQLTQLLLSEEQLLRNVIIICLSVRKEGKTVCMICISR